ncbi:aldehyde oxygenase (deformylating) [Sarracenia purpurea var. burkii]
MSCRGVWQFSGNLVLGLNVVQDLAKIWPRSLDVELFLQWCLEIAVVSHSGKYIGVWQLQRFDNYSDFAIAEFCSGKCSCVLPGSNFWQVQLSGKLLMSMGEELHNNEELISKDATQVRIRGILSKIAYAITSDLYQSGIQITVLHITEYMKFNFNIEFGNNLVLSTSYTEKICGALEQGQVYGSGVFEQWSGFGVRSTFLMDSCKVWFGAVVSCRGVWKFSGIRLECDATYGQDLAQMG